MKKILRLDLIIFIAITLLVYSSFTKEKYQKQLLNNRRIGVAKIKEVRYGKHSNISYYLFVDGVRLENSDPLHSSTLEPHTRNGTPIVNKFYPVEYDSTNPNNSKIVITKKPLNPLKLIENGIEINGTISSMGLKLKNFVDIYVKYNHNGANFIVRTRINRDSLSCLSYGKCKDSIIKLRISNLYPYFNSLYYKSYDRRNELAELEK